MQKGNMQKPIIAAKLFSEEQRSFLNITTQLFGDVYASRKNTK